MIENKIGKVIDTYYTLGNHDDISIAEEPVIFFVILSFYFNFISGVRCYGQIIINHLLASPSI